METSAKGRASGASRVLRWVPDRLPLRFAALQASGKARLMVWAQLSPLLSRAHAAKRNATRGQRKKLPRSGAELISQRSRQGRELSRLTLNSYRTIHRASTQRGASGGVLEVGAGCGVWPAHAERCPGFSAGRILTRKGASPGLGGGLARPG